MQIKKNKNKIEKPILNFKKDQYVGDWFFLLIYIGRKIITRI